MQFTALSTIPSMEGKSRELRVLFAEIANEALSKGRTTDEAIFQALSVVRQKEQKEVQKFVKPSIPKHLQALLDLKNNPQAHQEALSALEIENPVEDTLPPEKEIAGIEFDAKGRLILKFRDGKTIVSNVAPITAVESSVVVVDGKSSTGAVGTLVFQAITGEAIGGHRVVIHNGGSLYYASSQNIAHLNKVVGLTTLAATLGATSSYVSEGVVTEPSWTWDILKPVYLAENGLMTQFPANTTGFTMIIGMPVSSTSLYVSLKTPILL